MQQHCTYGSVRGAPGDRRPYRDESCLGGLAAGFYVARHSDELRVALRRDPPSRCKVLRKKDSVLLGGKSLEAVSMILMVCAAQRSQM